ncbi:hypothetical protein BDK51DRAFT_42603 [Blyttiomyces helicus]|uniref:Uncharacterized protein n=1 Tax=Blyttiomyces helicus TaxID=388810 RepID=A0A4P9WGD3_9FUNG|nr:hypothetical protein BDK51DRAFT_42603 [Blyttiomyces helicus]|eukprot:RKO90873.1 hypothetical protein BDK51DRAFT_42603 [Blyttiomyces helicus]
MPKSASTPSRARAGARPSAVRPRPPRPTPSRICTCGAPKTGAPPQTPPATPAPQALLIDATFRAPASSGARSINLAAALAVRMWFPPDAHRSATPPPSPTMAELSPVSTPDASTSPSPSPSTSTPLHPPNAHHPPAPNLPSQSVLTLRTFLTQALHKTGLSTHCLFFSLLLMLRLATAVRDSNIRPEPTAEIRLVGVALLLADATLNDCPVPTRVWAGLLGLEKGEVVRMKMEFLRGIGFDLSVGKSYGMFLARVVVPLLEAGVGGNGEGLGVLDIPGSVRLNVRHIYESGKARGSRGNSAPSKIQSKKAATLRNRQIARLATATSGFCHLSLDVGLGVVAAPLPLPAKGLIGSICISPPLLPDNQEAVRASRNSNPMVSDDAFTIPPILSPRALRPLDLSADILSPAKRRGQKRAPPAATPRLQRRCPSIPAQ